MKISRLKPKRWVSRKIFHWISQWKSMKEKEEPFSQKCAMEFCVKMLRILIDYHFYHYKAHLHMKNAMRVNFSHAHRRNWNFRFLWTSEVRKKIFFAVSDRHISCVFVYLFLKESSQYLRFEKKIMRRKKTRTTGFEPSNFNCILRISAVGFQKKITILNSPRLR